MQGKALYSASAVNTRVTGGMALPLPKAISFASRAAGASKYPAKGRLLEGKGWACCLACLTGNQGAVVFPAHAAR